jgi:rhodanese-related sulfurtransferase
MYGAAQAVGKTDIRFDALVNRDCVSTGEGSTEEDLLRAAEILGVSATPISGSSLITLGLTSQPIVLHVSSFGQFNNYNHWELFLGWENDGRLRLVDGDGKVYLEEASVLASRWDGTAIVVSSGNSINEFLVLTAGEWFVKISGLITAFLLLSTIVKIVGSSHWLRVAVIVSVLASAVAAVLILGPISSSSSRASIERSFGLFNPDVVEFSELKNIDQIQFIDARLAVDFDRGHLPNAKSLPINSGKALFAATIDELEEGKPVVLYCHSLRCEYDKALAKQLYVAGIENFTVMKEGYVEWRAAGLPTEKGNF